MLRGLAIILVAFGFAVDSDRVAAESRTALWDALRSGSHVALMRHAIAPGTGDPEEFTIGDCNTQRNLSPQGRTQAAEIGQRFRLNGISTARVFSSQWCRCVETARLLELGPVQELPSLNSFYQRSENREPQTQVLREWISSQDLDGVTILVTHQVNITSLTSVFAGSGELVIVHVPDDGKMTVVGTIVPD